MREFCPYMVIVRKRSFFNLIIAFQMNDIWLKIIFYVLEHPDVTE